MFIQERGIMTEPFLTVYKGGSGDITEKKSKFIASVYPVKSEEEALTYIEQAKKKYWDASHNCYAYVIGAKDEIQRCSDDGEPSKTAGRPMLEVLLGEGVHNALVIVTRYFGGTLLGTGGLVRAYQGAAKEGLKNSVIIEKLCGRKIKITTDYTGYGKLQYLSSQLEVRFLETKYTDIVTVIALVQTDKVEKFIKKTIEATNGQAETEELEAVYYAVISGELKIFDL